MDSDKHEEIRWSLFGICFLGILVCCGILMCIGFYHVFFEEPAGAGTSPL